MNQIYNRIYLLWKQGLHISSFPRYYHTETIASECGKFLQKMFWFNFIYFTVGYFNEYWRFCNFKQTWNYTTFISTFFTLLKFINDTVNETQWAISLHKLFFYQRDFFVKFWWYSFWTMNITIDYILLISFWSFRFTVKIALCFSDKRLIYRHHWCWWVWCPKTY